MFGTQRLAHALETCSLEALALLDSVLRCADGRRLKVTMEKEELIRKLRAEGHNVVAIARLVGMTRQICYAVLNRIGHGVKSRKAPMIDLLGVAKLLASDKDDDRPATDANPCLVG